MCSCVKPCIIALGFPCWWVHGAQTVADQVRLWQADMRRVRHTRADLYEAFDSPAAFAAAAAHARAASTWLWQDDARGRLVAAYAGHGAMRVFFRANQ